MISDDIAELIW